MQNYQLKHHTLKNNETLYFRDVNSQHNNQFAIVLIHGNFSDISWWDQVVQELIPLGIRIIVPDLRGFGKSSYNNRCSRFRHWASDVIELCEFLQIKKAIFNGWSFGGAISMKIAEIAPQLAIKLILTCSVSHQGLETKDDEGNAPKVKQQICKIPKVAYSLKVMQDNNKAAMRQIYDLILYQKMQSFSEDRKKRLAESPFSQRCYPELLESLANPDIDAQKIKSKTLMIHGNEDFVIPVASVTSTATILGKLDIWQNHAHMIPLEDLKRYCKQIISFIKNE